MFGNEFPWPSFRVINSHFRTVVVFTFVVSSISIFCFLYIQLKKFFKYLKQNTTIFNKTQNQLKTPVNHELPTYQESGTNSENPGGPSSNENKITTDKELGLDFDEKDFANPPDPQNSKSKSVLGLGGIVSLLITSNSYVVIYVGSTYYEWQTNYIIAAFTYLSTNIIVSFVLPFMFFVRQPKCIQTVFNILLRK